MHRERERGREKYSSGTHLKGLPSEAAVRERCPTVSARRTGAGGRVFSFALTVEDVRVFFFFLSAFLLVFTDLRSSRSLSNSGLGGAMARSLGSDEDDADGEVGDTAPFVVRVMTVRSARAINFAWFSICRLGVVMML